MKAAMAEMRILPVRFQGVDGAMRLSGELAAAYARGQNLGPRTPHIRAGGNRLLELSLELRFAIDDLDRSLTKIGLQDQAAVLRRLLGVIQELAGAALRFPASD